jgi:hypothetical protein
VRRCQSKQPPVYAAAKTEESLEVPDIAELPKIPASLILSEELLEDPPRPVRAIKELQEPAPYLILPFQILPLRRVR